MSALLYNASRDESKRRNVVLDEIERLRKLYPFQFNDGVAVGLGSNLPGLREPWGYPAGFHGWPLDRRNAWFAGFNFSYSRSMRDDD